MFHFFVAPENVSENEITVIGNDVNHIKNVLRMKIGEKFAKIGKTKFRRGVIWTSNPYANRSGSKSEP